MKEYKLKQKAIPMDDSWDVIVTGGGPAGCTAAAAASREGARTLLLESTGCLGGMGTSGLVPAWCPFGDREKIIYRGLAGKIFETVKKGMPHVKKNATDWVPIDPELLKRTYDNLVVDYGAAVLFNTMLCSVDMDDRESVSAVIACNKSGMTAFRAKVYVDCTGDADLAAWAGAEFMKAEDQGEELQPATHCFILSNVDDYGFCHGRGEVHHSNPHSPIHRILKSGKYPLIPDKHMCAGYLGPGTIGFNAGHIWQADNTDPAAVSKALMLGRKMAEEYRKALAEFYPEAFANSFLAATASLLGIRETRRIIGDYILTVEDFIQRRSFADEICRNSYFIDIHNTSAEREAAYNGNYNSDARYAHYKPGESHGIPYRCLVPKRLKNVLVAGRSISCDRPVQGSIRVMPPCLAMGEAAGAAAAMAAEDTEHNTRKVDTEYLRRRLKEEGAYLP